VRPFLSDEPGRPTIVDYIGENGEIVLVNPSQQGGKDSRKAFAFNKVFGTMASQGTAAFSSPSSSESEEGIQASKLTMSLSSQI